MLSEKPAVVFFDMDHTVISIDCDVSWKYFLSSEGLAPASDCAKADHFLEIYHKGESSCEEFVEFQLHEFIGNTENEMQELAQRHFESAVRKTVYPSAQLEIENLLTLDIPIVLLTGTNRIIAEPVARLLGMSDLIATELEILDERFTGKIIEPYLMKEGKVKLADEYCSANHTSLNEAVFYADSITDVPLLEKVGRPVVINPNGKKLLELAKSRKWRIEHWSLN